MRVEAVIHHEASSAFVPLWDVVALISHFNAKDVRPPPPFSTATAVAELTVISPADAAGFVAFLERAQPNLKQGIENDAAQTMIVDRFNRVVSFFKSLSGSDQSASVIG